MSKFFWVDLEMTGLDADNDLIMEGKIFVTDGNLKNRVEGPHFVIGIPKHTLDSMDKWCIDHHGDSGLTKECLNSTTTIAEADDMFMKFIKLHSTKGEGYLAGNSVHQDLAFMRRGMPKSVMQLHYRIFDVSTIKIVAQENYPNTPEFVKSGSHTATSDILESIGEYEHYLKHIFK